MNPSCHVATLPCHLDLQVMCRGIWWMCPGFKSVYLSDYYFTKLRNENVYDWKNHVIRYTFTASSIKQLFWEVWFGSSGWECQWVSGWLCVSDCICQNEGWDKKERRSVSQTDVCALSLISLQVRRVSHPHLCRQLNRLLLGTINTQPTLYLVWRGRCRSALLLYCREWGQTSQTSCLGVLLFESSARS